MVNFLRADGTWAAPVGTTDELVKISVADTTAGFLNAKLSPGAGLTSTILNPAANEVLEIDVVANADGSIVVNANDIQVGVLATDAQHGTRGGGTLHALAVASGAAGFISGADQQKLDDLVEDYSDYAETEGSTTTAVAAFVQAETLAFTTPAAGTYRIAWSFEAKCDTVGGIVRTRVQLNAADQMFGDIPITTSVTTDQPISGFREVALGAGAQTLDLDFFALVGGTTVELRRRRLEVRRVS